MVDFKKLRASQTQQPATDPIEIFRHLPKPPEIADLYTSQAEVLRAWYDRQDERDLVIKLHTGGGKTLVGLLIAQSIMNKTHGPVLYLSPTTQLVDQIAEKAKAYSIPAVVYEKAKWGELPDAFLNGQSVLICTYHALFNARSRFGVRGAGKEIIHVVGIILDDAHVAFSTMRDAFTLRIDRGDDSEGYAYLTHLFRDDFSDLDKAGSFDDIVAGSSVWGDYGMLEVPYWSWQSKSAQVREYLRTKAEEEVQAKTQGKTKAEAYRFVWPFLRDAFDYCHCFITHQALVITPFFPLVESIPTFANCPHRVFMSATIGDDSAIVRTFDAKVESIKQPIISNSLAGVSERMILVPELMRLRQSEIPQILQKLASMMAETEDVGTIILVPSLSASKPWEVVAKVANSPDLVTMYVKQLRKGSLRGPFVFANRYDGIDLPGRSCRFLIMSGLPHGGGEYDVYRANIFMDSASINNELMQRIEQGIGRGARGASDYCVVILTGRDLVSRLTRYTNQQLLTSSTRAQLEIGLAVSKDVDSEEALRETMMSCIKRDKDWIAYHADSLASLTASNQVDTKQLDLAAIERKAFQLMRDSYFEKAITQLEGYCESTPTLDLKSKGWLFQFAACIAHRWGNVDEAQRLQRHAYANNNNLLRPQVTPPYVPLPMPSKQAEEIVERIDRYRPRRGYMAEFERVVAHLVPTASSNQFEEALAELGSMLGFRTERPEKIYKVGPDVLWLLNDHMGMVIEAKSQKEPNNPLTKDEHGQLLNAEVWFKKEYPRYVCIRVSVHPNTSITKSVVAGESKVLTFDMLRKLIIDLRHLLESLTSSLVSYSDLVMQCEQLLAASTLEPQSLAQHYLVPFSEESWANNARGKV